VGRADAGSGLVEREQALEDLLVGEVGGPAIGGDRRVQLPVDVVEPGRALVVEVGERSLLQLLGAFLVLGRIRSG
jgi:hypothetical protein